MHLCFALRGALFGLLTIVVAGCAHEQRPADVTATQSVKTKAASDRFVSVSAPTVMQHDGILEVSGTIARQPGFDGPIPGWLQMTIAAPDGKVLQSIPLGRDALVITASGTRTSTYSIKYGYVVPTGSIVKVERLAPPPLPSYAAGVNGGTAGGHSQDHSTGGPASNYLMSHELSGGPISGANNSSAYGAPAGSPVGFGGAGAQVRTWQQYNSDFSARSQSNLAMPTSHTNTPTDSGSQR